MGRTRTSPESLSGNGDLTVSGTPVEQGGAGRSVQDARPVSIWAVITGHVAGNRYAFSRVDDGDVPAFGELAGAPEVGDGTTLAAYEINGSGSVPDGAKVRLWPAGGGDEPYYTFVYGGPGTGGTTTTTTSGPGEACPGACHWTYSLGAQAWALDSSTCEDDCHCLAPTWCPSSNACAETACGSVVENQKPPYCGGFTTTAGPGDPCYGANTTTTLSPTLCTEGCDWYCHPIKGWIGKTNGCSAHCPCPKPAVGCGPGNYCETEHTECVVQPPPPVPCRCCGGCEWIWVEDVEVGVSRWEFVTGSCQSTPANPRCRCDAPDVPGTCAQRVYTLCYDHSVTTSGPCAVPTTISPTTSSPGACDGYCLLGTNNGTDWNLFHQFCSECGCAAPAAPPSDLCSQAQVPCVPAPPTTTTTTSADCGSCLGNCVNVGNGQGEYLTINDLGCNGDCGCKQFNGMPCTPGTVNVVPCGTTSSPLPDCSGYCTYQCADAGTWALSSNVCSGTEDCGCVSLGGACTPGTYISISCRVPWSTTTVGPTTTAGPTVYCWECTSFGHSVYICGQTDPKLEGPCSQGAGFPNAGDCETGCRGTTTTAAPSCSGSCYYTCSGEGIITGVGTSTCVGVACECADFTGKRCVPGRELMTGCCSGPQCLTTTTATPATTTPAPPTTTTPAPPATTTAAVIPTTTTTGPTTTAVPTTTAGATTTPGGCSGTCFYTCTGGAMTLSGSSCAGNPCGCASSLPGVCSEGGTTMAGCSSSGGTVVVGPEPDPECGGGYCTWTCNGSFWSGNFNPCGFPCDCQGGSPEDFGQVCGPENVGGQVKIGCVNAL